jgi:hypothetical protein
MELEGRRKSSDALVRSDARVFVRSRLPKPRQRPRRRMTRMEMMKDL